MTQGQAPRRLRLWIAHPSRGNVGPVTPWYTVNAKVLLNDVGAYRIVAPASARNQLMLDEGCRIVAKDEGRHVFSGPIVRAEVRVASDHPDGLLAIEGITDEHVLLDRLVYPDPGRAAEAQTTASHHRLSGRASTVIREYVRLQAGPDAYSSGTIDRRQQIDLGVDGLVGATISGAGRYDNLLTFLQGLATQGGVQFRVDSKDNLERLLVVTAPNDLSRSVTVSARRRTMTNGTFWYNAPKTNAVITGSQGELENRTVIERYDAASQTKWDRRIESFRDQRAEGDTTQVAKDTQTALDDGAATAAVKFEAQDTDKVRCGRDYWLGDVIRARLLDGTAADVTAIVPEIEIEQGPIVPLYRPIVGEGGGATNTRKPILDVQRLMDRLQRLEAAQ